MILEKITTKMLHKKNKIPLLWYNKTERKFIKTIYTGNKAYIKDTTYKNQAGSRKF